jgi:cytochrome c oxidase subunit 3
VLEYPSQGAHGQHHEPPTFFESLGHPLAHHFEDMGQQKEAATLGMWLFLATEVLLFGGMFAGYFAYRYNYPRAWESGSHQLIWWLGSLNTAVLLASSFCVAMAIHEAQANRSKGIVVYLLLTIAFGAMFLVVKGVEYYIDYEEKLIPWMSDFAVPHMEHADAALVPQVRMFMLFYFIMTMIHASHMIAGISVMGVLAWMAHKGKFTDRWYTPVEMAGLYWHFVDIVWVFLLPALYFVRTQ